MDNNLNEQWGNLYSGCGVSNNHQVLRSSNGSLYWILVMICRVSPLISLSVKCKIFHPLF
jgi:hypothetical protein